ncbi:cytochrome bd-I ubiquinol oxidase subunit 1 apoprotein [Murinocardiopsis flavida]|uniref:Cytochrome bd-I ubiquinol oxidase subunit 1 apoprotein n=1 Tax=Murinocardiopsis flavida TaxID=645275 RepID=A0A2P8DV03_9ACTN|nr:cytochrome ubiquinol oxidase subunit I [Murinocardiopsis flavida]PSL01063.1 cytochrome bd-I ubiquinol oxidase subunit 1 apoprotein [Murinocardiopsis flavida]
MFDDPLMWARLQFALTAGTHYLFVAFTLGMAPVILFAQLNAARRRDEARMRAVRFWGGLYLVNYGMGILSGLVMELQLALNWSGLNEMFGYAFAAPLAVETMVAFFIESTFLGLWIFGWDRMGRWAHWSCFLVVTLTAYLSAYWVLVANGFMRFPVGFEIRDGVAVLTDIGALAANPSTLLAFAHIIAGSLLVGGLIVAAVSAYHLVRGYDPDGMFGRGIRTGALLTAIGAFPTVTFGGMQYMVRGMENPTKGMTLSAAEIEAVERSRGAGTEVVAGLGSAVMTFAWLFISVLAVLMLLAWLVRRIDRWRWLHWVLVFAPFLPFGATIGGWVEREVGRQPWAVQYHLTTADAVTPMTNGQAALSFVLFTVSFAVLATVTWFLIVRFARRGPDGSPLAPQQVPAAEPPAPVHRF